MSDRYQILAFVDVGEGEVTACEARVLALLWDRSIVEREPRRAPFPRAAMARWLDPSLTAAEAERQLDDMEAMNARKRAYRTDDGARAVVVEGAGSPPRSPDAFPFGLEVIAIRAVHADINVAFAATCRACSAVTRDLRWWREPLAAAAQAWSETGSGALTCSACGASSDVTVWRFEPGAACAYFALRFGNWPALRDSFVAELAAVARSRVVLVHELV